VQRIIRRDNLLTNVQRQGTHLAQRLKDRFGNHHHVGDVRGRGLFQAIELVRDRASKEPFDPKLKLHARIKQEAMARGLMVYPMGGTIDGARGDHVLLAPPFIVQPEMIDTIIDRLGDAVDAALTSVT
jgi:adenosylmethionine-8-amino-7-oxononanoate aminotransferase